MGGIHLHLIILPSIKRYKTKTLTRDVSGKIMSLNITLINSDNNSDVSDVSRLQYRVFSLTWPASMQIYWNKRKRLHKKRVQLPEDCFGTPTWPPFHCFGTPIWPPWRHVKTLYRKSTLDPGFTAIFFMLLVYSSVNHTDSTLVIMTR